MFYRLRNRSELIRQQNAIESGRRRNLTSSSCKERPPQKPNSFSLVWVLATRARSLSMAFPGVLSDSALSGQAYYLVHFEGTRNCLFESGQPQRAPEKGWPIRTRCAPVKRAGHSGELLAMESGSLSRSARSLTVLLLSLQRASVTQQSTLIQSSFLELTDGLLDLEILQSPISCGRRGNS